MRSEEKEISSVRKCLAYGWTVAPFSDDGPMEEFTRKL